MGQNHFFRGLWRDRNRDFCVTQPTASRTETPWQENACNLTLLFPHWHTLWAEEPGRCLVWWPESGIWSFSSKSHYCTSLPVSAKLNLGERGGMQGWRWGRHIDRHSDKRWVSELKLVRQRSHCQDHYTTSKRHPVTLGRKNTHLQKSTELHQDSRTDSCRAMQEMRCYRREKTLLPVQSCCCTNRV